MLFVFAVVAAARKQDPDKFNRLPECIEEFLDYGTAISCAFNRPGTLLASAKAASPASLAAAHQHSTVATHAAYCGTIIEHTRQHAAADCLPMHHVQHSHHAPNCRPQHLETQLECYYTDCVPSLCFLAGTDNGYIGIWDFETRGLAKTLPVDG
jgi:hypothetical protein